MGTITDPTGVDPHDRSGSKMRKFRLSTGPVSYPTGGESLTPAEIGLSAIDLLIPNLASNGTVILCVLYDYTNSKMKWFDLAGVEIANATDLSAYSFRLEAIGH